MGVRMAVEMALEAPSKHKEPIYTFGPLIHNTQVLNLLEEKGVTVLEDIPESGEGTVLIRAHGVPPQAKTHLQKAGFNVIDATCPRVIKVQTIIKKHAENGYRTIIIGDENHPEVVGLMGYTREKGHVVGDIETLEQLPVFDKAIVVAQTTQNTHFFKRIRSIIQKKSPHYLIFNTICDSTEKRQAEVKKMAEAVDAIIVVGGKSSGNTQRLAEIANNQGKPTYHIETENDLDFDAVSSFHRIGITAGASTPNWIIRRVHRALETHFFQRNRTIKKFFFSAQRVLLLTNIYVALGAGALCYASTRLCRIPHRFSYDLIAILYVLSMHIFHNLTREGDRYNEPDRAHFYQLHKWPLAMLAFFAGGMGLIIAYMMGVFPFLVLLLMSVLGLSYNLRLFPGKGFLGKYRTIKDFPGSKTVLIAVAWGIVTSVFPALSVTGAVDSAALVAFLWSTGMVFIRTGFFDFLDMQGDRIVGKDTIPILLGEKKTISLLKTISFIIAALLLLSGVVGVIPSLGIWIAVCPLSLFFVILANEKEHTFPYIRLEFLVESHFIFAGIIALIWSLF